MAAVNLIAVFLMFSIEIFNANQMQIAQKIAKVIQIRHHKNNRCKQILYTVHGFYCFTGHRYKNI